MLSTSSPLVLNYVSYRLVQVATTALHPALVLEAATASLRSVRTGSFFRKVFVVSYIAGCGSFQVSILLSGVLISLNLLIYALLPTKILGLCVSILPAALDCLQLVYLVANNKVRLIIIMLAVGQMDGIAKQMQKYKVDGEALQEVRRNKGGKIKRNQFQDIYH